MRLLMETRQDKNNDPRYQAWIVATCATFEAAYGQCHKMAEALVTVFPELRIAKGFYHDPLWGRRQHGWCVDPEGRIVDPTSHQFPSAGFAEYEELSAEEIPLRAPTGVCMTCGVDTYQGKTFCGDSCQRSFEEDLGQ